MKSELDKFPDEQLVLLIQSGHDRAFAVLYERHRRRFQDRLARGSYPFALRRAEAREVLQDAFLDTFEHLDEFGGTTRGAFRRWAHERVEGQIRHAVRHRWTAYPPRVRTHAKRRHA